MPHAAALQVDVEPDWVGVCRLGDLTPGRAVCALVAGRQVAVVLTADGGLFGLSNRDPFSGAFVLSRGIIGSRTVDGDVIPVLQSPMYKQAFDLRSGRCLEDSGIVVETYAVRLVEDVVAVRTRPVAPAQEEAR